MTIRDHYSDKEIREIIRQMLDDWNKATPMQRRAALEAAEAGFVDVDASSNTALVATYLEREED